MTNRKYGLRLLFAAVAMLVAGGAASAVPPQLAAELNGSLTTDSGIRVLRVWGTPEYRGYAHGFLLGEEILSLFEDVVLNPRIIEKPKQYELKIRRQFLKSVKFTPEQEAELKGMLTGIGDKMGHRGTRLERVGRNIDVADLKAINCMADWYSMFCSSFSAWGEATVDGGTITARNLDFLALPGLDTAHVVIVHLEPGTGKQPWVSVAWPGLIGAYTAMNSEGVTISMHDAPGLRNTHRGPFVPRSLALRDALESARAATAVVDVQRVLARAPSIVGNNIHVSAPSAGQPDPAAVFEYDGNISADSGVTKRLSTASPLKNWLLCTNHYCQRKEAPTNPDNDSVRRFSSIEKALQQAGREHRKIDLGVAWEIIGGAGVSTTFQTVVYMPNRKEIHVGLASPGVPAFEVQPVRFVLGDLLTKRR